MKNKDIYKFDPLKHGFEPITNYPELGFNYPMIDKYFVKIICYSEHEILSYWYLVLTNGIGLFPDDRIEIKKGVYTFRNPSEYGKQNNPSTVYSGLISNDKFAENLLKHLLGTTRNDSLRTDSIVRYNENVGIKMRKEYPNYYLV